MTDKEVLQKTKHIAIQKGMPLIEKECPDDYTIIFSHDFAKAFFGNENSDIPTIKKLDVGHYMFDDQSQWKAHLQQMVLEENPIDYLRKFIKDK